MSGKIVRASKYRHIYGKQAKKEKFYEPIKLTNNAFDSNLIKANSKYISVNWNAIGGGAFAVIPIAEFGKLPDQIPLFRGHKGPLLDTAWNPFDDEMVASGSDDGTVALWKVPANYTIKYEDVEDIKDVTPFKILHGHGRKVGCLQFHPSAANILASASADNTIKIWNIETGENLFTLTHKDLVTSFSFNYDGSLIASTGRDKRIRIWDVRKESIVSEGPGHTGIKSSRLVWLGKEDRIVTTGFSKLSDRQMALWNTKDIAAGPIGGFRFLDSSTGICMPFYDEDTTCLYLGGKGDGNIRYYEYADDELYFLSEYMSGDPQRGLATVPKKGLDIYDHEVVRFYKTVNEAAIHPISFIVPKKAQSFQEDIYPPTRASEPALSAEDWASGKDSDPKLVSLANLFEKQEESVQESASQVPKSSPKEEKKIVIPEDKPKVFSKVVSEDVSEPFSTPSVQKMLKKASEEPIQESKTAASKEISSWDLEDDKKEVMSSQKIVTPEEKLKETANFIKKNFEEAPKEEKPTEEKQEEVKPTDVKPKEEPPKEVRPKEVKSTDERPTDEKPKEPIQKETKTISPKKEKSSEELKQEIRKELREELKEKWRVELRQELKNELRDEIRKELREEFKQEIKKEISAEIKNDLKELENGSQVDAVDELVNDSKFETVESKQINGERKETDEKSD